MNQNTENAMARAFKNIMACVPEKTEEGNFDEAAQLIKVKREYKEAVDAYEIWLVDGDKKSETEYLEEVADTVTALATLLWAHTSNDKVPGRRIELVFAMVNLKNRLRGYHDFEREGEKK